MVCGFPRNKTELEFVISFHGVFGWQMEGSLVFSNSVFDGSHHSQEGWKEFDSILHFLLEDQNTLIKYIEISKNIYKKNGLYVKLKKSKKIFRFYYSCPFQFHPNRGMTDYDYSFLQLIHCNYIYFNICCEGILVLNKKGRD